MANTSAAVRALEFCKPARYLRSDPKPLSLEIPALKPLLPFGLSCGEITQINGCRASGRTSIGFHMLAQATRRGEVCAVVDLGDNFHPASAAAAGVRLEQLLWVRCRGNAEHAMYAADLLLHAGGFGVVLLDLCEASPRVLNRIPLSYWYRFQRAIEHTPTILVICSATPQVKSSSAKKLHLKRKAVHWIGNGPFLVLEGIECDGILTENAAPLVQPLWMETVA